MEHQTDNLYMEEIGSEINCDMEIAYRKARKRRKVALVAAAVVIALVAMGCIADLCGLPILRYRSGIAKWEREEYTQAQAVFEKLGDYKDAQARAAECGRLHELVGAYQQGKQYYQTGRWLEAYRTLAMIRDENYLDTAEILDTIVNKVNSYMEIYAQTGERGKILALLEIIEEYDAQKGSALREELIGEESFEVDYSFYYLDTTHSKWFTVDTPIEEFASLATYMLLHGEMEGEMRSETAVERDISREKALQGCDLMRAILPGYGSIYNINILVSDYSVRFKLNYDGEEYNEFQRTQHLKTFKTFCEESVRQLAELGLLSQSMSYRQKAEVIINWVGYYLTYDDSLTINDVGVAIENRLGVCEAFAAIYNRMCNLAGVPAYGQSGGGHIWSFHVDEDGIIFYADATWADPWDIDFSAPGQEAPTVEQFARDYLERCLRQILYDHAQMGGYPSSNNYVNAEKRWTSHEAALDEERIIDYHAKITGKID